MNSNLGELIKYLDEKFICVDKQFEQIRKEFSDLHTSVDSYAKKADTYFQKMVMLGHKVDRHEKWIAQIAKKLDIDLEY